MTLPKLDDTVADALAPLFGGDVDCIAAVAVPLPVALLGQLLGLTEAERAALLSWVEATLLPSAGPPRARDTLATMATLIGGALARAGAGPADTVLGRMLAEGPDQAAGLLFYLLFVWYEIVVDLLGAAVGALLALPDRFAGPVESPVVEELLRYVSPQILAGPRFALTDMQIGEHMIRRGQTVLACLASANHDPARTHFFAR